MSWQKQLAALALLGLTGCLVALAVYRFRGNIFDPLDRGRWAAEDEIVGQERAAIEGKYGPPTTEAPGHYGSPPVEYLRQHDRAVTVTYKRATGTLYLSYEQQQGEWVCFRSRWLPDR